MKKTKWAGAIALAMFLLLAACSTPATVAPTSAPATSAPAAAPTTAAAGAATAAPTQAGAASGQKRTIKIGLFVPMTGPLAFIGEGYLAGAKLALQDLGGSIEGNPVEFISADSKGTPSDAVAAVRKLAEVDNVDAMIGGGASSVTLGGIPIIGQEQVPSVDGSSTNPTIFNMLGTGRNPWQFRIGPDDLIMGQGFAEYVSKQVKSVAFVGDDNDFGHGAGKVYVPTFGKLSTKVVSEDYFDPGTADYRPFLTRLKGSGSEAVFLVMTDQSCATFMRQFREVGLTQKIFSRGSCVSGLFNQLTSDNPKIGEGILEFSFFTEGQDKKLDQHYFDTYKQPVTPHRISGYYAMYYALGPAISNVLKSGKPLTRQNIRDAIAALKVETPGGTISFDDHNQAYPNGTLSTDKDGKAVLVDTTPLKPVDHTGY